MHVYLARHEEAEPGHTIPDRQRSLTGFGRQHGRATGQLLVRLPDPIDTIWTSPLVRAVQTAEIFAGALGIDDGVSAVAMIAEPPSIAELRSLIVDSPANIRGLMLVGHQPTLGILISTLLGAEYPRSLRPGTVVALNVDRRTERAAFRWAIEGVPPAVVDDIEA